MTLAPCAFTDPPDEVSCARCRYVRGNHLHNIEEGGCLCPCVCCGHPAGRYVRPEPLRP